MAWECDNCGSVFDKPKTETCPDCSGTLKPKISMQKSTAGIESESKITAKEERQQEKKTKRDVARQEAIRDADEIPPFIEDLQKKLDEHSSATTRTSGKEWHYHNFMRKILEDKLDYLLKIKKKEINELVDKLDSVPEIKSRIKEINYGLGVYGYKGHEWKRYAYLRDMLKEHPLPP